MLQIQEHLFLATHLRNKSLFLHRLFGPQLFQIGKMRTFHLLFLIAFPHQLLQHFNFLTVLIQDMVHPVNLTVGISFLSQQAIKNPRFAIASIYIQTTNSFFHGVLANFDFSIQRIDIGRKLDNRTFQHKFTLGKFRNISTRLIQVLIQD